MAFILKRVGNTPNTPSHYYACDDAADLAQINTAEIPMGSECYIINAGETYILNSAKEWKKEPSGGGISPTDTIVYDGGTVALRG